MQRQEALAVEHYAGAQCDESCPAARTFVVLTSTSNKALHKVEKAILINWSSYGDPHAARGARNDSTMLSTRFFLVVHAVCATIVAIALLGGAADWMEGGEQLQPGERREVD